MRPTSCDLAVARRRDRDDVRGGASSAARAWASAAGSGTPRVLQPLGRVDDVLGRVVLQRVLEFLEALVARTDQRLQISPRARACRYQRVTPSTSRSTPSTSSASISRSVPGSSASMAAKRPIAPVTSRAMR